MFCKPDTYRRYLLENLDTLEAVIHRAVITYDRLQLQSQDVQINPVQAVDDSLNVSKSSWIELENHNALSKSVNETQLQQHESLVTESTTLEANLNSDFKALDEWRRRLTRDAEQYQAKSPLLNVELVKSKEMIEKETYNELSRSVKDASNEAKVKNDIDVIETINIELEHSVAKLLAANEHVDIKKMSILK
ncbi:hypothetical protein Tco_0151974 [Tanacetum coccineum]